MEEVNKGIHLTAMRYKAEERDMMGMLYRAYDHIKEANEVIVPFMEARRAYHEREEAAFEASLTEEEKDALEYIEAYQSRSPFWRALSIRPSNEQVNTWKRITDKRTELASLKANPLMNLVAEDGEQMIKDLIEGWKKKGFGLHSRQQESNGEYVKETIKMEWTS